MIAPRKILLSRTDRLGDLILSTPAATAIKKHFPAAKIHFLAANYAAEILKMHPHVDGVISLDAGGKRLTSKALAALLQSHHFDAVIALHPRPELAWAFLRAGIPMRIGTGYRWYSLSYTHRIYEHRKYALRHEAECNLQLLAPLGILTPKVEFHFQIEARVEQALQNRLAALGVKESFAVLHPGSGGSARDWPPEYFSELADLLASALQIQVVLTGSVPEKTLVQGVQRRAHAQLLDLSGRLTLTELAVLLRRAALFVGNSTGPLHLARMVGAPVIAFYPPIRACWPERWGPYGCRQDVLMSQEEECHRCRRAEASVCQCMREISVAAAFQKAAEKIGKQPHRQACEAAVLAH